MNRPQNPLGEESCIFCKIAKGEIPSAKLYEDEHTVAFLDIKPNNPGHTLVIPKKHYRNIFDIDNTRLAQVAATVRKLAPAIRDGVSAGGLNINNNNERPAGQIIFHYHVHIIPRFETDGYKFWPQKEYPPGEAEKVAAQIRAKLS